MEIVQLSEHLIQNQHLLLEFKIYNYTSMTSIADIKQQQAINKAFTKAGYSLSTLNNLTKQVTLANNPIAAKKIKNSD